MISFQKNFTLAGIFVVCLLILGFTLHTESKSINKVLKKEQKHREPQETLIALPSSDQGQHTSSGSGPANAIAQEGPTYTVVHEVHYQPVGAPQYQSYISPLQQQRQDSYSRENQQQVAQPDTNRAHKQEYVPLIGFNQQQYVSNDYSDAKNREYPGQIIYMDPNDKVGAIEQPSTSSQTGGTGFPSDGSMIYQDSNLPATILTEVPVKDMPQEVLEKLKKDYGVKVVATREHPGANLIINCEDYASQEYTICARAPQFAPAATNNQEPSAYSGRGAGSTNGEDNHQGDPQTEVANEQPQIPNETGNYAENSADPQPETFVPRSSQANNPGEPSSYDNRQNDYSRDYGIRNAPSSPDESDGLMPPQSANGHDSAAQSDSNSNHDGSGERTENESNSFDVSGSSKNSHQYVSRHD